jgi:2-methylisocitrate lyase-like PEP mutase family enzyme
MLLGRIPSHQELVERFCERLRQGRLIIPGAVDPLAGLLAKSAGFSVLYLSGAALSASYGLPDVGVLTLDEVAARAARIIAATGLPLVVDIDTGFGEVFNAVRAAQELLARWGGRGAAGGSRDAQALRALGGEAPRSPGGDGPEDPRDQKSLPYALRAGAHRCAGR